MATPVKMSKGLVYIADLCLQLVADLSHSGEVGGGLHLMLSELVAQPLCQYKAIKYV